MPNELQTALRRLVAVSTRVDHEVGATAGVTVSTCDGHALNVLLQHGALSPGRIGQLAGFTSSGTVTGVIDRLERAGYVHRKRCVEDRRKVVVELDEERLDAGDARSRRLAAIAEDYDAEQLALITDFLTRVADAEAAAALPGPDGVH
ncbi:MarR family winged helix-turn-helix transcriptional regulator [Pseudonocardia kunmingensis]|uniref:MarR family protein n=1 Tax=Pseudonocardia kunmingensis TaxID=630975 RepID=A0A543DRM1_9PSEU|nr:MarR family transcriptional regulator [Pseudonocardia kunmingensis]TQM11986.1 MarR family protein [Pseudonocardia kunmingensis]